MRARIQQIGIITLMGVLALVVVPISGAHGPSIQQTTAPEVYAEAVGQANLRGGPGIDYPLVGQIVAGTRYRVLARHSLVPWLKLEYAPAAPAEAWVYVDLVQVMGDLGLVPAVNDFAPVVTSTSAQPPVPTGTPESLPAITNTPSPSLTPTLMGPMATTLGKANIRFGPGVEYPIVAEAPAGASYRLLAFHTLVPWVQIAVPDSPNGTGWIFQDVIEITGDTSQTLRTNAFQFGYPTPTPTPQMVVVNGVPWNDAPAPAGSLASTLGQAMFDYLLKQGFVPYTDQIASVFVLDLQTGDTFTLNDGIAYSGMSLTKIPILVTYFQRHRGPLTFDEAFLIGDTMMCSENITTNQLLEQIGEGDPLRGAQRVTALMQSLGLGGTFIMRQYVTQENEAPVEVGTIHTGADQSSARPDAYNQVVPKELGWLLAGIYQCAQNGTGLLMERYPNDFNPQECRQMLRAMDANEIGVFLEAGVPEGTRVIHKHGWIGDTHGDAGIVIGPKGAYVFVAVLYNEGWLEFDRSAPVIAELSRMVWNALNPEQPVDAIHPGIVPAECDPRSDPVIEALLSENLPAPGPATTPSASGSLQ